MPNVHQRNSEQGSANSLRVSVGESTFEYRSNFASDMPSNFKLLDHYPTMEFPFSSVACTWSVHRTACRLYIPPFPLSYLAPEAFVTGPLQ